MLNVLADGEWHPMDRVIRAGTRVVPPSKGQQWYRTGLANPRTGTLPSRVKATDTHDQVRDGRWDGCRRVLTALARRGVIEIDNPSGGKSVSGKRVRLVRK